MAIETLYDKDGSLNPLSGKTVAVLGYGSQGHAHAQNLRDSGVKVIVANRRESANGKLAIEHGFDPLPVADAVQQADLRSTSSWSRPRAPATRCVGNMSVAVVCLA